MSRVQIPSPTPVESKANSELLSALLLLLIIWERYWEQMTRGIFPHYDKFEGCDLLTFKVDLIRDRPQGQGGVNILNRHLKFQSCLGTTNVQSLTFTNGHL